MSKLFNSYEHHECNYPKLKLKIIIQSFVAAHKENPNVVYVNESKLHNIVISEGMKVWHTKDVDKGFIVFLRVVRI